MNIRKQFYFTIPISLFIVIFSFTLACGGTNAGVETTEVVEEPVEEENVEVEPKEEVATDIETLEQNALSILEENFEGTADVEFVKEEETFYLTPTDPTFMSELMDTVNGQAYAVESWEALVENQIGFSESMKELFQGYRIAIRNPANPELSLLVVSDGVVLYDFLKDDEKPAVEEVAEEPEKGEEDSDTSNTSPEETDSATLGEKNALKSALDYLDYTAFSYNGLVDQLKYEGFTHEEAVYGVDRCGADWNEQAALKAEDYLNYSSFSYSGLVEQLKFEGYTHEEAVYGVDKCGADWNEQAAKKAEDYLNYSSFSRTELIAQLEFEGFTRQQAEFGAQAVGY